jgi:hypothetical protein
MCCTELLIAVVFCRIFCDLFPELVGLNNTRQQEKKLNSNVNGEQVTSVSDGNSAALSQNDQLLSWPALVAIFAAVVACFWALFSYIV